MDIAPIAAPAEVTPPPPPPAERTYYDPIAGPITPELHVGVDMIHTTRPGFLRIDQTLGLGQILGQQNGYQSVQDAITAAQPFSAGNQPATIVRELNGQFFVNQIGEMQQRTDQYGRPWGRPYYSAESLSSLRNGDTVEKLNPSVQALVQGDQVVTFGNGFKVTLPQAPTTTQPLPAPPA